MPDPQAANPQATKPVSPSTGKTDALAPFRADGDGQTLTTNQGVPIADNQNSLRAGARGPTLLEDFILREKITHFDHERIPERIVHARGEAAHGHFQVYESLARYTRAKFLQDPAVKTPVFVRFSTVGGSRGSADTVRDVRGFAVKFYTEDGNYDLVGNNMPVFFIQDAIKFPDFVHAVKPEPHNEIPQASSAHDTFWDFVSLVPEATHMVMWLMSDRAIPRSLRMMEGFGVHTFRLVNAAGEAHFVKFHWKPLLGMHSLAWDEAQKLAGKDADFNRRDLWDAIEQGDYPEWELGLQIIPEADEHKFGFDLLDPTKLVPEELVPVTRVGKMTLNRNPDNFFAETEQVAFCPGHIVPGIDFTNDPLLQGRLFSYTDTQLLRLGGPNFHEIPINRPVCPFHNNQRDGLHRQTVNPGRAAYEPNSFGGGPKERSVEDGGFASYTEKVEGSKIRVRSESFADHFSQATMFWNSQSDWEREHIVSAFRFELAKVETPEIRQRMVNNLVRVDPALAAMVAQDLGLTAPSGQKQSVKDRAGVEASPALSMANTAHDSIKSRQVAVLAADGVNAQAVQEMKQALEAAGAHVKVLAPRLGPIQPGAGQLAVGMGAPLAADHTLATMPSVAFDAVFVPGGAASVQALKASGDAVHFVMEAYKHGKAVAAVAEGVELLRPVGVDPQGGNGPLPDGVVAEPAATPGAETARKFIAAIAAHRHWGRKNVMAIPA